MKSLPQTLPTRSSQLRSELRVQNKSEELETVNSQWHFPAESTKKILRLGLVISIHQETVLRKPALRLLNRADCHVSGNTRVCAFNGVFQIKLRLFITIINITG